MTLLKHIFWDERFSRLRAAWRLVNQLVLLLVCLAILGFLAQQLDNYAPRDPLEESVNIFTSVSIGLSILLSVWLAGHFFDRRCFADFGFRFNRSWWIDLVFGLALAALLQTGIFLIEMASGWITITGTWYASKGSPTFPVSILLILISFVGVGISEELWNRGYLMKNVAEGLNFKPLSPKGAILLTAFGTAAIFGLFHAVNPSANVISTLALVLAGLLYATAYALTGELAIPIGYHIGWNFFEGAVFGFSVSGYPLDASFIASQVEGPGLWTGGDFGPEAGLLGILSRVTGILLIMIWVRFRYKQLNLREELVTPDLWKHT